MAPCRLDNRLRYLNGHRVEATAVTASPELVTPSRATTSPASSASTAIGVRVVAGGEHAKE